MYRSTRRKRYECVTHVQCVRLDKSVSVGDVLKNMVVITSKTENKAPFILLLASFAFILVYMYMQLGCTTKLVC